MKGFSKDDYILSFLVQGVSVFVTDIHVDVYKELEVLFLIDNGVFKQYFTKVAYEKALDRGLEFYSDKDVFKKYRSDLIQHIGTFKDFYANEIKGKKELSREATETFFEYTTKLCKDYTLMNFEHTDKAFSEQENNPTLKENLSKASKFKDKVREYMNEVLFETDGYANEVFQILGKQIKINPSVLNNLTQQEILDLFDDKKPNAELVSKRENAFVINYDRSQTLQGWEASEILDEFRENVSEDNVVTGKTASIGTATGKVKIINVDYSDLTILSKEIAKMNEGDILISETTAPELIIACKKAAAIVTDIGGLLSHAAIVSREFGIPCIVGTENATKVFKDGDIVKVDAEKGTVEMIHHSN